MIVLSQTFSTREEGIKELSRLSPTIGVLLYSYRHLTYENLSSVLARFIDRRPHPKKAKEPFEEGDAKLVLTPGHLRFKGQDISVEIVPEGEGWKFTLSGFEVDDTVRLTRNHKRATIMGWEVKEEFPEEEWH